MKRVAIIAFGAVLAFTPNLSALNAQVITSHSSGFFVGLGVEGVGIVTSHSGRSSTHESGSGAGLELGYGFSPGWSLYGAISGANIDAEGGGSYRLTHVDLGARVHFRTGPNVVVPFIQFGLAGRDEREDGGSQSVSANGGGVSLGAGLNAHFNPAFAFTGNVTWTVGNFTNFQIGQQSVEGSSVTATSSRVHLGLVWFPGA